MHLPFVVSGFQNGGDWRQILKILLQNTETFSTVLTTNSVLNKMSMPDIHNCLYLSTENERIRKKYKKLARRNGQLEKELNDLKEQFRNNEFMQTFTRR